MRYLYAFLALGFLVFVGCPPAETAGPEEVTAEETPAVTVEEAPAVETVSPETTAIETTSAETTAVETTGAETTAVETTATTTEAPPATPAEEVAPSPKMGYRVQIGAFTYEEGANRMKMRAESELNQKVYVDFIEGMYKVRVGDFLTREDAEAYRDKLIGMGYNGAFLVETEISP